MYLPRAFAETDLAQLDQLIAAHPLVTLITCDDAGAPFASHLPVLYQRRQDQVLIEGHWARPNPQVQHGGNALLIVHGPDAYVSPGWYTDKEEAARVPTWNYAVAHLHGTLERFTDEADLADLVDRLSREHEARVGQDWRFDASRADHREQLRGIVGFRLRPSRVQLKFKLNQNHPAANIRSAAAALATQGHHDATAIAELMRERLPGTAK